MLLKWPVDWLKVSTLVVYEDERLARRNCATMKGVLKTDNCLFSAIIGRR